MQSSFFLRFIKRKFIKRDPRKPTLVWQSDTRNGWESDWLSGLLSGIVSENFVDNTRSCIVDPMIIVDNKLSLEKIPYYREAFEKGCRVVLVHLSDEGFRDDLGAYKYCNAVIRNYWSKRLGNRANVMFTPLGYKAGFAKPDHTPKPALERRYLWSFAGNSMMHRRDAMLEAMVTLPRGFTHLSSDFNGADALSTDAYRALMDDTVVVPCPGGGNQETFRVYEALEAGCIPIVERRADSDYFTLLLGQHPIPTVSNWREGASLVRQLDAANDIERVRAECAEWWITYKIRLAGTIAQFIKRALA